MVWKAVRQRSLLAVVSRTSSLELNTIVMWLLLALLGCMDRLMEAPYVMATGLERVDGIVPTTRGSLLAATAQGLYEVDETGARFALLPDQSVQAVTSHGDQLYLLADQRLRWGTYPAPGEPLSLSGEADGAGVVDIQAWCEGRVLVATETHLELWSPVDGTREAWAGPFEGVRRISLQGEPPCDGALVLLEDRLLRVQEGRRTELVAGLVDARALTIDRQGTPWLVSGEPPVLARLVDGRPQLVARYLSDPADIHFGIGVGLLPTQNLYIADRKGTIDYVHVPLAAPQQ